MDSQAVENDLARIALSPHCRIEISQAYSFSQGMMLVATISEQETNSAGAKRWTPIVKNLALGTPDETKSVAAYLTKLGLLLEGVLVSAAKEVPVDA